MRVKDGVTNVDVAALAADLRDQIVGARFDKAFQPAKDQVLLRFRRKGSGRQDLLFELGRFATLTKRPPANPDAPSMVAKILRKTFGNARVRGVAQIGFDRLLRIDLERGDGRRAIVLELFGDGNLIILDSEGTIELPMRGGDFGARRVRKGEAYQPPPGGSRPFEMDLAELRRAGGDAKRDLVRFLALDLGFGPLWGEELCLRADVVKTAKPPSLGDAEWAAIHAAIQELSAAITAADLTPAVVFEGEAPVDALPFVMQRYPRPAFAYEEANSFVEALDTFFIGGEEPEGEESDDPRRPRFEEARGKLRRQLDQMEGAIAGFEQEEADERLHGDTLYACFQDVQGLLDNLTQARETRSWQEIAQVLADGRAAGNPAAQMVLDLRPHNGTALLALTTTDGEPREVEIDLRKSVQENADDHYTASKKARSRREGAGKAVDDARKRLADLEKAGLDAFGKAPDRRERVSRHFWFETYRWTITPGGFVAVGGRSAPQNDAVVKKYMRAGDRYVHAEIHGAPSVVVRTPDGSSRDVEEADLEAACHFAACASRAWRTFGQASAYWVTPEQVSKTPRSGEFVPRGAWIVHGKRNTIAHLPMVWAVGEVLFAIDGRPLKPEDAEAVDRPPVPKLVGGALNVIREYATRWVLMEPGDLSANDAAATLSKAFDSTIEDAQAALPGGPVRFTQWHGLSEPKADDDLEDDS